MSGSRRTATAVPPDTDIHQTRENPVRRTTRNRTAALLAALGALVALASGATSAGAASQRGADLATYDRAAFLRTALDLPVKPKLVIESVTYDRT